MDLGTLADWANAVTTLVATGVAAVGGRIAYKAYQREQVNDRQHHASGVHAWLASDVEEPMGGQRSIVMNSGESLIYDLRVELIVNGEPASAPTRAGSWQVLPPGLYAVGPHETYPWGLPVAIDKPARYKPYTRSQKHRVTGIEFTDARGTIWRRDERGQLAETPDSVPTAQGDA